MLCFCMLCVVADPVFLCAAVDASCVEQYIYLAERFLILTSFLI